MRKVRVQVFQIGDYGAVGMDDEELGAGAVHCLRACHGDGPPGVGQVVLHPVLESTMWRLP
mgnify:CR=1 FL=1